MDHLEAATQLWVLVLQRVEAVWAAGQNATRPVSLQTFDVRLGEDLIQVFVASAASRIAAAALLFAQDREPHVGGLEDLDQRHGHPLVARVERRHATDPVDGLELARIGNLSQLLDTRRGRPVRACAGREGVRIAVSFEVVEQRDQLLRKAALLEHEVAAHLNDERYMLDAHRALLHARAAGGAIPELVLRDHLADKLGRDRHLRQAWLVHRGEVVAGDTRLSEPRPGWTGEQARVAIQVRANLYD